MKKIMAVFFCFAVVFSAAMFSAGCSKLFPAAAATATSTPIPTPTATADITGDIIMGMLSSVNVLGIPTITYQIAVYSPASVTITTANVTVSGPAGVKTLVYNATSGYYEYGSANATDFQYGKKYTITVIDGPDTYVQDIITTSDIVVASDGSTVTWTNGSPGIPNNTIVVTDPAMTPHMYGPGVTSPYNLTSAGAYTYGTGTYLISTVFSTNQNPAFGGSNPVSTIITANSKTSFVIKF